LPASQEVMSVKLRNVLVVDEQVFDRPCPPGDFFIIVRRFVVRLVAVLSLLIVIVDVIVVIIVVIVVKVAIDTVLEDSSVFIVSVVLYINELKIRLIKAIPHGCLTLIL
jgi:hypothetical protein